MKLRFPFKSLRTGLILTYLFLIASSLGLLAWRVGASLDASRFAETRRDQEGRAILAASVMGDWLAGYWEGRSSRNVLVDEVETLSRQVSQPVAILDKSGKVLIDTEHPNEIDHDDSTDLEIAAALAGNVGNLVRFDPDGDGMVLFTVAPIRYERELIGFVRIELPMRLVEEASQQLWLRIIAATVLAGFVTIIVSLWFARALTNPLARLTHGVTAVANGDLKHRIQVSGPEELEQLGNGFNFMAERIEHVMEDQRAFVASAAHELRTPLTTIRLRAEALADGAKDDPQVSTQFLGDILSETDRLSRLVTQLLDLSRIETGLVTPRRERVSLEAIARTVADELGHTMQSRVECVIDAPNDLPAVTADPDQMRQVFINLLSNAIKFAPANSTITIRVQHVRAAQVVDELPRGNWLLASVADSGVGIPEEELSHVFDRFYRGDKARARSGQSDGAGLGLAIVKSIVEAHRGRVWVTSRLGQGATFSFALPCDI